MLSNAILVVFPCGWSMNKFRIALKTEWAIRQVARGRHGRESAAASAEITRVERQARQAA
jgi:hypothetical protein